MSTDEEFRGDVIHEYHEDPPSLTVHTLRLGNNYQNAKKYHSRIAPGLLKAFDDVYIPFGKGLPLPRAARHRLDAFTLTSDQYYVLVANRERPHGILVSLEDGKLVFDECTLRPHGQVITEIGHQIYAQNQPELFVSSIGESMFNLCLCL